MFWITCREAQKILNAKNKVSLNLDLEKTLKTWEIEIVNNKALFPDGSEIDLKTLEKVAKDENTIYFIKDGEIYKAVISNDGFYKLVSTIPPTIEINGIRMHRTKGTDPYKDTLEKINTIKPKKGEFILDTCMGLGYTAIECAKRGARVITIEKNPNVLEIAKINPYSRELFTNKNIEIRMGNAFDVVKEFEDERFDAIVHDPPRFSLAGELYSEEFYRELYRILKPGGRLFHYVGNPGRKYRHKDLQRGVMERLRNAGFVDVRRIEEALGVVGRKV
ncbi:class I SAM-dependent methyltransferase [Methanotorris formicicus]|uniref:Methyltransferase type 11 n=1 Tax=Methanotorris formicicus Mc-S-70 TaxID=647171 RepID=H1KZ39_9EURY|nr:methyltransferase domain-containing protein [Methanotorris formicicus]EHP86464.1 Methyltransferase type 11 [Methanotorris formicicus Mc-S-70]